MAKIKSEVLSLTPLVVFLAVYLVSSILARDFYAIPVSSAFLIACIYAVIISKGTIRERIDSFSAGAGNSNVLMMIWIFIMAGAFAGTARDIGAVDATVNAALSIIPPRMLCAGLFLTACFISMSIGTSVGTIVALVPIAAGIASQCGYETPYMAAVVVGGALFGDNLSFISDTTIAATRAAGCRMNEKFKANILIVLPAVVIVTIIYLIQGSAAADVPATGDFQLFRVVPYLIIIVLALMGMNVSIVLAVGILANAIIGLCSGSFDWAGLLSSMGKGISGMGDLIVVTLLAGGLLELIKRGGGMDLIIHRLTAHISGPRGAMASIAALVCLANLCTANNTIAIITTGGIAKNIADRFGISPRSTASILDTFSCFVQGIIPYGAQILMAAGLASVSPVSIIPYLYYPFVMGICAVVAILIGHPHNSRAVCK